MFAVLVHGNRGYESGHSDGYLPAAFYGPFADRTDADYFASTHSGIVFTLYAPWDETTPGNYISMWFGRMGTFDLIGPFATSEDARHFLYEDELTISDGTCVLELIHPDEIN